MDAVPSVIKETESHLTGPETGSFEKSNVKSASPQTASWLTAIALQ